MRWNEGLEIVDARDINIQPMRVTTGCHRLFISALVIRVCRHEVKLSSEGSVKDCRLSAVSSPRSASVPLDAASKQTVRKQRPLQDPDFRTHLLPLRNVIWLRIEIFNQHIVQTIASKPSQFTWYIQCMILDGLEGNPWALCLAAGPFGCGGMLKIQLGQSHTSWARMEIFNQHIWLYNLKRRNRSFWHKEKILYPTISAFVSDFQQQIVM
jgi:hypothetical protein